MFDELEKYKEADHFFFSADQQLSEVCNAPTDKSGVIVVHGLKGGRLELVYIGRSGELKNGVMSVRKTGLGGLKDTLVNGQQFGSPRHTSWMVRMLVDKIEAVDVYWYATHGEDYVDCPKELEKTLLARFKDIYGRVPLWNRLK